MKYLATTLTTILLLSGCGSSNSTNDTPIKNTGISPLSDNLLEFKTEGVYDLNDYLFSNGITTKTFKVKQYINDSNPRDTVFGIINGSTKVFTQTMNKDEDRVVFNKDNIKNIEYTLLDDRIQAENGDTSSPIDIVRFADMGDYIGNIEGITDKSVICKLNDHLESKNNFSDVLQIVCDDQSGLYKGEYFFAKDIGSILEINTICTKDDTNKLNCKNIVTEYIVPN